MSVSGEDSDATVLEEEDSQTEGPVSQEVVCESPINGSPGSPSMLHSLHHLTNQRAQAAHSYSSSVPSEEEMSQEFPPLTTQGHTGAVSVGKKHPPNKSPSSLPADPCTEQTKRSQPTTSNQPTLSNTPSESLRNPPTPSADPTSSHELNLTSISQQQTTLLQAIKHLKTKLNLSTESIADIKRRASVLESQLKDISIANQAERKRLANAHSSFSQQTNTQEEFVSQSQALKQQLLGLANKQKQLLECFTRQKEIGAELADLAKICIKQAEANDPSRQASTRELVSSLKSLHVSTARGPLQLANIASGKLQTQVQPTQHSSGSSNLHTSIQEAGTYIHSQLQSRLPIQTDSSHQLPVNLSTATSALTNFQPTSVGHTSSRQPSKTPSDLSEPVPLDVLIKHGFIHPDRDCLSCKILGCQFKSSLLRDGRILDGKNEDTQYQVPQQWVKACWSQLGHHQKKITRKMAYTCVLYKGTPLSSFCEKYSLKQVSSYLSQKSSSKVSNAAPTVPVSRVCAKESNKAINTSATVNRSLPPPATTRTSMGQASFIRCHPQFNLSNLLHTGSVLLLTPVHRGCSTSLSVPKGFWSNKEVILTPELLQQLQTDLDW